MMTPEEMAAYGHAAISAGTPDLAANDERTNAVDTITNVFHYCHVHELDDVRSIVDSALSHFAAELAGD